jgi:hypothetical protein
MFITVSLQVREYHPVFLFNFHLEWIRDGYKRLSESTVLKMTALHRKKKVRDREFLVPSRDVTTKLSLGGNNDVTTKLFLPRGSLVSDIPAGDGKLVNFFYGVLSNEIFQSVTSESAKILKVHMRMITRPG